MYQSITNWNCRGFRKNIDEIKMLMRDYDPIAFGCQETLYLEELEKGICERMGLITVNYDKFRVTPVESPDVIQKLKISMMMCLRIRFPTPR